MRQPNYWKNDNNEPLIKNCAGLLKKNYRQVGSVDVFMGDENQITPKHSKTKLTAFSEWLITKKYSVI